MRSKLVIATAALAALVLAPSALAKGPFEICGVAGCSVLGSETQPPVRLFGVVSAVAYVAPPAPAPYYVIRFAEVDAPLAYWVPSVRALRIVSQSGRGTWLATLADEDTILREKTAGLAPYAPPTRVKASVQFEPVKRATGYLRLYTMGRPVTAPSVGWLMVWLSGGNSPWTDFTNVFWISKTGSFLKRDDGTVVTIPASVAKKIRARLPLG
jgi:hypothetical protein